MSNVFVHESELVFSGLEVQSCAVYAESLACWFRAVIEHVAEMGITLQESKKDKADDIDFCITAALFNYSVKRIVKISFKA